MKLTVLGAAVWVMAWPVFMLATHAPLTPLILMALFVAAWRAMSDKEPIAMRRVALHSLRTPTNRGSPWTIG
jgi:hypothetical protein